MAEPEVRPDPSHAGAELTVNYLARRVQNHVPDQPLSDRGVGNLTRAPVPVELSFDASPRGGGPPVWRCRFVAGLKGARRVWGRVEGPTVETVLRAALAEQERGGG